MRVFDTIELVPVDTQFYSPHHDENRRLNFSRLCKQSLKEAKKGKMQPITPWGIHENPVGLALVGVWSGPRIPEKATVIGHIAVTDVEDTKPGEVTATVGSLLVMPSARGFKFGERLLEALQAAAKSEIPSLTGFKAVCNDDSLPVFLRCEFEVAPQTIEDGKTIVHKPVQ